MMTAILKPWQLGVIAVAGWIHRSQQLQLEYLKTEVAVLKELHRGRRILLDDDQRCRLAAKGKTLGYQRLSEVCRLFTPDTIMRWHRELIARKWDHSDQRSSQVGRPRVRQVIVDCVLRFARENPHWGCDRIQGALSGVGYRISDSTIGNILKAHGIEPAPDRKRTGSWAVFLKAHWETLAATDFTTVEVWTPRGLTTIYLLFVMELKTRTVHFAGSTTNPHEPWMKNTARELTNHHDGFLLGKTHLILDRDTKFCESFHAVLRAEGIEPVKTAVRAPNMNAHMERFFRSLKSELTNRMIFFGETPLRRAVKAYLEHYHTERHHQGLGNELIIPLDKPPDISKPIETHQRLGGLLRFYHRAA